MPTIDLVMSVCRLLQPRAVAALQTFAVYILQLLRSRVCLRDSQPAVATCSWVFVTMGSRVLPVLCCVCYFRTVMSCLTHSHCSKCLCVCARLCLCASVCACICCSSQIGLGRAEPRLVSNILSGAQGFLKYSALFYTLPGEVITHSLIHTFLTPPTLALTLQLHN